MRRSMSAMKQVGADRQKTDRRNVTDDRKSGVVRAADRDGLGNPNEPVAAAMVDALEDILKWERTSERAIYVADSRDVS
jgi:hypothetical protein